MSRPLFVHSFVLQQYYNKHSPINLQYIIHTLAMLLCVNYVENIKWNNRKQPFFFVSASKSVTLFTVLYCFKHITSPNNFFFLFYFLACSDSHIVVLVFIQRARCMCAVNNTAECLTFFGMEFLPSACSEPAYTVRTHSKKLQ